MPALRLGVYTELLFTYWTFICHMSLFITDVIPFSTSSHLVILFIYIFLSGYFGSLYHSLSLSFWPLSCSKKPSPSFQCFLLSIILSQLIGIWAMKIISRDQFWTLCHLALPLIIWMMIIKSNSKLKGVAVT